MICRPVASCREEHHHCCRRRADDPADPSAAALGTGRRRKKADAVLVLDELAEAEVRVLRPRRDPLRRRPRRLAPTADDELDLRSEQEHDRHPDRNPGANVVAEEPCHDEDERRSPHCGLDGRSVGAPPHGRRVGSERH